MKPQAYWIIFFAGIIGMCLALFLTITHYTGTGSACPKPSAGEKPSCDIVNQSSYSEILGIPIAAIAFLVFLFYTAASWQLWHGKGLTFLSKELTIGELKRGIFALSATSLLFAIYLVYILYAILQTACVYCLFTHAITLIIFLTSGWNLFMAKP